MTTKTDITKLIPSELIRAALLDLRACVRDPRYTVSMKVWHAPTREGPCYVCLAGSVMAQSLGADVSAPKNPDDFPGLVGARLDALDYFRMGCVWSGLECCGLSGKKAQAIHDKLKRGLDDFDLDECAFDDFDVDDLDHAMTWLADQLEKEDL